MGHRPHSHASARWRSLTKGLLISATTRTITLDDVLAVIPTLDHNADNPTNDLDVCVYTGSDGSHCIAGQVFAALDLRIPADNDPDVRRSDASYDGPTQTASPRDLACAHFFGDNVEFEGNALGFLNELQQNADGERGHGSWGRAINTTVRRFGVALA